MITLLRVLKKTNISKTKSILIRFGAIFLALFTSTLFIHFLGHNPISVYISMLDGCFGSLYRFKETIIKTIPLVIASLGILVAFKMKFWNIGGEGQIYMGAFLSSLVALKLPQVPKPMLLMLMVVAGIIGGGIWALIPALFKAKYGTNETLFTLMMNYIAIKWITYLQFGPWKDPNALGFPKIPNFSDNAILPRLFGVHIGWIFAIILVILTYVFIHHTKKGYEISVIGESENTGRYAGMNVKKIIITAMLISGGLCGLTGMIQASAVNNTLSVELSGGIGYTAIIVTWLSNLSAPLILLVSFLFAILIQGGAYIQTAFQIPQSAAQILQGMILMFVLGSEFFVNYKLVLDREILTYGKDIRKGV
ncbi:ABC transporter permease [Paramaledivibacter caminithermalis]|jgi:simple sugar transport system permease protein|uniref:Nucleoside ABC transporter membrane protein n=1 Tax=Paramaledivibacter caminithermalis (strain DSM 15212 / CIP 107654 / DViRD3) TaxID=1121301 RepID=A0A1M6S6Q2_PARC5|nr:ABC transporter permease [Paramaledivibacter caminithermalis]SHK40228.1 nucleoside ABC transporter membrane protein [Paramaledivibacter caminithermalis DSM 15212]